MDKKEHYLLLDGLRGLAALMILCYHLFEAVAFAEGAPEQEMFHGFLAVDFFLILSGFVMGHAYDDGWGKRFGIGGFFKRRLIRLHPMVVVSVLVGLLIFLCQGRMKWDGTQASWLYIGISTVMSLFLIPQSSTLDVRGNTELFPLNGPLWSLFFEYIGSIMYALLLRRLSTKALKIWVGVAAVALILIGILGPDGSIAYGWSSKPVNMLGGFLRMAFSYPAGLLLARLFRSRNPERLGSWVFWICATVLLTLLWVPSLGNAKVVYEIMVVCIAFPAIIWFGARGLSPEKGVRFSILRALGDISYPLYAIHYPMIYLYIGWISNDRHPFGDAPWSTPLAVGIICVVVAMHFTILYDKRVRKYLTEKFVR